MHMPTYVSAAYVVLCDLKPLGNEEEMFNYVKPEFIGHIVRNRILGEVN